MRYLIALVVPLFVQFYALLLVFDASRGGGSFMGLLAIPVAAIAVPVLAISGFLGARGTLPLSRVALMSFAIALLPPIVLLVLRLLES
ncbi:hypothetical protein [Solimonas terrae]|uniref:Uncharacterized protein n=1 Tax=Solimonas terrae TaxID=1396819 RepID=A0A6M2BS32_9GAMM|nr:hypothetical protein [Solimonas terrae]NGY05021.1 hypothetical protein [Solimonas terrae]